MRVAIGGRPPLTGSRIDGHKMYPGHMDTERTVTVRMFGLLHSARRAAGLESTVSVEVHEAGTNARQIALDLGLDTGIIEGVFVNGTVFDLGHPVMPGDRIAFVPHGTPGPHRLYLGLYRAGQTDTESQDSNESAVSEIEPDTSTQD